MNNWIWLLRYNGDLLGAFDDRDKAIDGIIQFCTANSSMSMCEQLWDMYIEENEIDEDEADFRDVMDWLKRKLKKDLYFLENNNFEFWVEACWLNKLM